MEGSLVVEEGMLDKFPPVSLPPVSFTYSSCLKALFTKKKLNNPIVEILKKPTT